MARASVLVPSYCRSLSCRYARWNTINRGKYSVYSIDQATNWTGNIDTNALMLLHAGSKQPPARSEAEKKPQEMMAQSRVMTTHGRRYIMGGVRQRCPLHAGPSPVERVFREGYLMADRAKSTLTPA